MKRASLLNLPTAIDSGSLPDAILSGELARRLGQSPPCTFAGVVHKPLEVLYEVHSKQIFNASAESSDEDDEGGEKILRQIWIDLGERILGHAYRCSPDSFRLGIYAPTLEQAETAYQELASSLPDEWQGASRQNGFFGIINVSQRGPCIRRVPLKEKSVLDDTELPLLYGRDGAKWIAGVETSLREMETGLILMTGPCGTGKTSFLRHLISRFEREIVFYYLGAQQWELLNRPDFTDFWLDQKPRFGGREAHKVLLIEDADELIRARDGGSMAGLSVLLNATDGLLSDFLQVTVIATCNTPIRQLDPAIARHGRLLGYRDFRRLSAEEAAAVASRYDRNLEGDADDYSLAEIFAPDPGFTIKPVAPIGFEVVG